MLISLSRYYRFTSKVHIGLWWIWAAAAPKVLTHNLNATMPNTLQILGISALKDSFHKIYDVTNLSCIFDLVGMFFGGMRNSWIKTLKSCVLVGCRLMVIWKPSLQISAWLWVCVDALIWGIATSIWMTTLRLACAKAFFTAKNIISTVRSLEALSATESDLKKSVSDFLFFLFFMANSHLEGFPGAH